MRHMPEHLTKRAVCFVGLMAAGIVFLSLLSTGASAQEAAPATYSVLYSFAGGDGAEPYAGLIADAGGNFYGTTHSGGSTSEIVCLELNLRGCGMVFKLASHRWPRGGSGCRALHGSASQADP